ncbi:ABC transporter substrate-binding protein [Lacrimispora sp. 210928-DFI.3.58]|uniref:ABC transporter substrate-binding protein n=1 Tax=Lacrimispora sp. 210928-DFI.3.58 TaxID=2883214 RepID=UPI001D06713C|nr:ABC transporter substrate-binding protein [Lacrimispora sp. 210928-DFI.3.58]MCB7317274.1 ABC transporter substrate-binding protein [Lacrimispora sp. 210928-DFI.3.58]
MKKNLLKRVAGLIVCMTMAASVAACGSGSSTKTTEGNASQAPSQAGGEAEDAPAQEYRDTIVLAIDQEPPSLCGLTMMTTTPSFMTMMETTQMVNELVLAEPGSEFAEEVKMALITDYEVSEDELTWTFTLKDGMKFAKGNPITAKDVVATLKVLVPFAEANPLAVPKGHYAQFKSVDYIDDLHFSITTYEPAPSMMRILCSYSSGVWDAELLEKYPLDELGWSYETMNASGPYQIKEWKSGEYVLLEANPNYYTVSVTGENAKTQYLKVVFIPDTSARAAALESGEVDVAYGLSAESAQLLKQNPDFVVTGSDNCSIYNVRFGCNDPIMSNVKVRQALVYALDVNAIAQNLYGDFWNEVKGFSSHVIWGFLDEGHIDQDQAKAKELLAEAGYPDGFETKIYASTTGYKYVELAEAVSAQLAEIGVKAEVVPVENSVYQEKIGGSRIEDFDYPLFIKETGGRTREFGSVVHTWYETSPDGTNGAQNNGFYSNAQVDELSAKANATMDDEARLDLFHQIQHICYKEDPPQINIAEMVDILCYSAKIQGLWCNAGGVLEFDQTVITK